MKILSLTAGAASMYCGSCLRDNALARELRRLGHDAVLVPVYTPTKTDEPNESKKDRVLFGGISVYLQQKSPLFRRLPAALDRLWDSRWALEMASKRSIAVDARELGEMTVAMLEGESGPIKREFEKLRAWLTGTERPDIINLPNTLLSSLATSIRQVYDGPIVCTMQGEDLFIEQLPEPHRTRSIQLIAKHAETVDAFIAVSDWYCDHMAGLLSIPRAKVHYVPVGVNGDDFVPSFDRDADEFTVGYLARVAPEKGLHVLADAWKLFREQTRLPARLKVAGYLGAEHGSYFESVQRKVADYGFEDEFDFQGELDRLGKIEFLSSLDVFCVPACYDDPKAIYVVEAMASGVPVVAPARGALLEHVNECEGGLLVCPDDAESIAAAFLELALNPSRRRALGAAGVFGVAKHRSLEGMARRTLAVYNSVLRVRQRVAAT